MAKKTERLCTKCGYSGSGSRDQCPKCHKRTWDKVEIPQNPSSPKSSGIPGTSQTPEKNSPTVRDNMGLGVITPESPRDSTHVSSEAITVENVEKKVEEPEPDTAETLPDAGPTPAQEGPEPITEDMCMFAVELLHSSAAEVTGYPGFNVTDKEAAVLKKPVYFLAKKYNITLDANIMIAVACIGALEAKKLAGFLRWQKEQKANKEPPKA